MTAPTRRAALGALASVPALALSAGAMASPAAIAAQVAELSAVPAPKQEAEALIEIGRRMPDLLDAFWKASAALNNARAQFNDNAPLPPKIRKRTKDEPKRMFNRPLIKIVRGAPAAYSRPMEVSPSQAYEALRDAIVRGESELTRKEIYQVSDRFQWKFFSAAGDCGLADALTRYRKASHALREVATQAFDFKPETRLGIAAQALALIGAAEAQGGRAGDAFAKALAMNLLKVEGRLAPDDFLVKGVADA